jgi:uncharacterized membrane protein YphA (DoxX/SURF4 family)
VIDPAIHWALRAALGAVFLAAAVHKLSDPQAFRSSVAGYRLVAVPLLPLLATLLPGVELCAGLALWLPGFESAALTGALALLTTYTAAISVNLWRGRRDIDCGCSGPAGRRRLSAGLVVRNGVLMALVAVCALPVVARAWHGTDTVTAIGGGVFLALVYVSQEVLAVNADRLHARSAAT